MNRNPSYNWSKTQAAKIILKTVYGDMIGFATARKKILATLSITQKNHDTGGRQITYLEGAETKDMQPVIMLHGTPGNALDWRWFLKKAAGQYQITAIDRPGFGPVDKKLPHLQNDMPVLRDLLLHCANGSQKPLLVGHSLGGGVAARLAADCSGDISGLILVGASLDPALEKVFPVQKYFSKPPLSWLLTRSVRNSNAELLQYMAFLEELQPLLSEIKCPVTVLHAHNDRLVPYANVDYVQKHCTNAAAMNIIALNSGGHFLNKTRPKDVLKALASFDEH